MKVKRGESGGRGGERRRGGLRSFVLLGSERVGFPTLGYNLDRDNNASFALQGRYESSSEAFENETAIQRSIAPSARVVSNDYGI